MGAIDIAYRRVTPLLGMKMHRIMPLLLVLCVSTADGGAGKNEKVLAETQQQPYEEMRLVEQLPESAVVLQKPAAAKKAAAPAPAPAGKKAAAKKAKKPKTLPKKLAPVVKELKEKLGKLQDCSKAKSTLQDCKRLHLKLHLASKPAAKKKPSKPAAKKKPI